ncbi:MAG: NADH-quinone oxidoreductase subunit A [Bacteroidota bacterium]
MLADYIPLFLMMVMAAGLALALLGASYFLGPKRPNRIKTAAYESGMDPVGNARERYSVKFYLVAMLFIVFDVEVVFLYPWIITFHDFLAEGAGLGVMMVVLFFIAILTIGLVYDIKKGGLDFD